MIVITEHGTKFQLDLEAKTWKRVDKTGDSGNLRTENGTYHTISDIVVGKPVTMFCPAISGHAISRMIQTSNIVKVEK